jgi:hypothetical protein
MRLPEAASSAKTFPLYLPLPAIPYTPSLHPLPHDAFAYTPSLPAFPYTPPRHPLHPPFPTPLPYTISSGNRWHLPVCKAMTHA